ncbi:MAG: type II secretion system F family protein [Nitrospirae bacterium]|nr:type II secretion system F family protein [Nitrospirota bacterium]
MAFYSYTAVNSDGTLIKGAMEGSDIETVRDTITSFGLYVITLRKLSHYNSYIRKLVLTRSVRRPEIIEFARNLSVMLKAGIPILKALSDIADGLENKYLQQTINRMRRKIEFGSSFSEAAACFNVFPDIFIRLSRVGEETGNLERSFSDLATHLEKMEDLSSSIKRALIYPAFAIVSTIGALLFWLVYVLPKVMEIFRNMGLALPLPTRILLHMSDFCRSYWYLLLITPVALLIFIKLLRRKEKIRYYMDLLTIRLPVIKHIAYNRLLALFTEQIRILTVAGITIDKSLETISGVISNEVFRNSIGRIREEIALGSRISDAIGKEKVFPTLVTRMIDVGESSGNLDKQFAHLSEHYLKKLDGVSQKIGTMIEPIVIGVIGSLFALIIMGLLLPIYDLVAKIGTL